MGKVIPMIFVLILILVACNKPPEYNDNQIPGSVTFDFEVDWEHPWSYSWFLMVREPGSTERSILVLSLYPRNNWFRPPLTLTNYYGEEIHYSDFANANIVRVTYSGYILASYPGVLADVTEVRLISNR